MAETTRNLGLPLLAAAQAQKHVTHNEAIALIDALAQLSVKDRDRNTPPATPAEGDRYIVGPAPTDAWAGLGGKLVLRLDGAWEAHAPQRGWLAYVEDEAVFVTWTGAAWDTFGDTPAQILAKLLAIDGDGSGLDADLFGGLASRTHAALGTMRTMMTGGGTLAVSAAAEVKWSARILATGMGRGAHWGTAGSFEITVPATGTIVTGLGGAANRSVTAAGIALNAGEALYYAPPIGGASASVAANFRVVGTGADTAVPAGFVCLCLRNPDTGDVTFWNGLKLAPGQSHDRATSTAARPKLSGLGIGTDSDAVNALAVSSGAVLFTHAGDGIQAKLNKAAAGKTASFLFQTAYAGRAEFGLIGSDAFSLKVSADGSSFTQAFSVDPASGQVAFDAGAMRDEVTVLTASGTWTKPAWAKSVTIMCMGGGGGGGSGRRGASASARGGGGGGGAGALNGEVFSASELPASLTVTIGAGGIGGALRTTDSANGANGGLGGTTIVADGASSLLVALGGGGGGGGTAAAGTAGTPGQGQSAGTVGTGGAGSLGTAAGSGLLGIQGGGGGGGGGGTSAADVAGTGGASGQGYGAGGVSRTSASVAGGAVGAGGNGGTAKAWARGAGSGGGGGGAGAAGGSGSGGAGGIGGIPGGGGGGGGGSTNGAASGAGGDGARGEVWILCRG